jgi:ABC-type amino acid transport substrate-binding protein
MRKDALMIQQSSKSAARFVWKIIFTVVICALSVSRALAGDLEEIKTRGVLRHLGVPYANFVTGSGDGLDVEMIKLFAMHLGVKYEYVKTTWERVFSDLTGKKITNTGDEVKITGDVPVKGDIAANGLTILPWRKKVADFSVATFPNQVWAVANGDAPLTPIIPSGDVQKDIKAVKAQLHGKVILGLTNTCVDPHLYGLEEAGAKIKSFRGSLNELVPAIMNGEGDICLQDVSGVLIAVEKWPDKVKILGPVSFMHNMGYAFDKNSPELRNAFNEFFDQCKKDGTYNRIVMKYYPAIFKFYPDFFN